MNKCKWCKKTEFSGEVLMLEKELTGGFRRCFTVCTECFEKLNYIEDLGLNVPVNLWSKIEEIHNKLDVMGQRLKNMDLRLDYLVKNKNRLKEDK